MQWAYAADFNVALLPLKKEYRNKFDVNKANEWFENEVEGLPYGYHNILFIHGLIHLIKIIHFSLLLNFYFQ